jgi:hypothetical protein
MPSKQQIRRYDTQIAIGMIVLLSIGILSGITLRNWAIVETYLPPILLGILLVLFYRLVVAVEHLAYGD